MITKLQEIFSIPELKRRVLFTLGLLVVYRIGSHITTPGVDATRPDGVLRAPAGNDPRPVRPLRGRQPREGDDLRARHHAVHQRVDHPAAVPGGHSVSSRSLRRKAMRAARRSRSTRATAPWCCRSIQGFGIAMFLESMRGPERRLSGDVPGLGFPPADDAHPDVRARSSSCGSASRSPSAASATGCRSLSPSGSSRATRSMRSTPSARFQIGQMTPFKLALILLMMVFVIAGVIFRDAGPTTHSGAVRQARGRAARVRGAGEPHPPLA